MYQPVKIHHAPLLPDCLSESLQRAIETDDATLLTPHIVPGSIHSIQEESRLPGLEEQGRGVRLACGRIACNAKVGLLVGDADEVGLSTFAQDFVAAECTRNEVLQPASADRLS